MLKNMLKNKNVCLALFVSVMVIFTIMSCSNGKSKSIKTAKSLVFYPDVYENQYQLGDVFESIFSDTNWSAEKIDGTWYVTVSGRLTDIDSLPYEMRQYFSIYSSLGIDFTKVIWYIDFVIDGNSGYEYSTCMYYLGEYSESESILLALYELYDQKVNY